MDRESLITQARDALTKLNDDSLLQIHPLADLLAPTLPPAGRGSALKQLLLELMQRLRPTHALPYESPAWRRYRCLCQLYLEGKSFDEIAAEEGVSNRQARRDHQQALEGLGDYLWARYLQLHEEQLTPTSLRPPGVPSGPIGPSPEAEVWRIGSLRAEQPIIFTDVLGGVLQVVLKLAERLDTRIDLAIADTLPPVKVHETPLRHALLGALSWAVEAAPGGCVTTSAVGVPAGVEVRIRVNSQLSGSIPSPGDDPRLLLGRQLIEMQGGRLAVHAGQRPGIALHLLLPAANAPVVLIVDDNPDVLQLFQRYLESTPYRLVQATTAEQALQITHELLPRLISLDLMMPGRDGWDLLQTLKRDPKMSAIPIVVCSVVHERTLALAMGASYFIAKPVNRADLLEVLQECGLRTTDRVQARLHAPN